jgi:hypothetical protein
MDACRHGSDAQWCYLCRIDEAGVDARVAWGLEDWETAELDAWEDAAGPMTAQQAAYLHFLCQEFGLPFDDTLTEGEVALVVDSFAREPMSDAQALTLQHLAGRAGVEVPTGLSYGEARGQIRRLVALQGLRAAG